MKLFGTDGIRGIAGEYPLDEKTITKIGAEAVKTLMKASKDRAVLMGYDTRESGPWIANTLAGAVAGQGVELWNAGVIPTPGVAYLTRKHPVLSGIVISASHNPFRDNGIKFFAHSGEKLPDSTEAVIEEGIKRGDGAPAARKAGIKDRPELVAEYEAFLKKAFSFKDGLTGMKLVIDCANGATYKIAPEIFASLGADVTVMNDKPDGKNINFGCGALHPESLGEEVKKRKAFCGMAFDGDGDRVIFTDENGVIRDGDYFLGICAKHLKSKGKLKNDLLVTTVMANLGLFKAMDREGIKVLKTPVGDKYVYEGLVAHGGIIGGEQSGHIILKEFLSTGDGILSSLQLLSVMKETGKTLSELCAVLKKFPQVLINTKVLKKVPVEKLPGTMKVIRDAEKKLGGDGRVLVRYSGTETLLRVMIEGADQEEINKMAADISETAKKEIEKAA
jgi:phosphoglucosamine mutase